MKLYKCEIKPIMQWILNNILHTVSISIIQNVLSKEI